MGGEMSTSIPTARLGGAGRDGAGDADRKLPPGLLLLQDSGLEVEPEEM